MTLTFSHHNGYAAVINHGDSPTWIYIVIDIMWNLELGFLLKKNKQIFKLITAVFMAADLQNVSIYTN